MRIGDGAALTRNVYVSVTTRLEQKGCLVDEYGDAGMSGRLSLSVKRGEDPRMNDRIDRGEVSLVSEYQCGEVTPVETAVR